MSHFPVSNSTLSSTHLAHFLEKVYDIGSNPCCHLLKTGINHTYQIDSEKGKFVFRVYSVNWRTDKEIEEEIRLLRILNSRNVTVSFPIPDQTGRYIQIFDAPEGPRQGMLFSFASGQKILNPSPETHRNIGVAMAKMHLVTQDLQLDRTTYSSQVLLLDPMEHIRHFLPPDTEEWLWMCTAQQYLLREFANIDTGQLRHGAVHLDIWFDNINIDTQNQATIFDFDFCGNGWLCLDIAYYVMQLHSTEKEEVVRTAKICAFLEGYESITQMSAEEKRILPMLGVSLYFFYLGVQSYRYDNWSNVFFNEVYLKRFILMLVKKYYDTNGLG